MKQILGIVATDLAVLLVMGLFIWAAGVHP
jgi:hypothetical protein